MNEEQDTRIRELLRAAEPKVGDDGPRRDLWPRMLKRLEATPIRSSRLDLVLAALTAAWLFIFPEIVLGILYQL
jgi:hypothetical protein